MKILVFVCGVIAVCSAIPSIYEEWTSFKSLHGKEYKTVKEENYRLGVFLSNKEFIEEHNAKFEAGLVSFQLKLNRFSDKLPEEVSLELNGYNRSGLAGARKPGLLKFSGYKGELPASVDWRALGAVTPVKDQGSCGACWAFSTTGSLEGQLFKKTGKLVSLSEQNLVDCSNEKYGNEGCGGGLMDRAFNYIRDNQGIDSEDSYPYEAQQNKCRFRKTSVAGSLQNFVDIPENDEKALQEAVATVGPISVAINAEPKTFTFYKDGIYDDATCNPGTLTHGVLLVGYGTENGKDYWFVKNSWNVNWGDKGYVKIARNKGNLCGIAAMASYPTV